MFGSMSIWEVLIIVLLIALLFGGKKLPQLGKGLGEAITNFKSSLSGKNSDAGDEKPAEKENSKEK